ncbi:NAD(P)-binding protein [Mollisia scopiformis]|uniref:NAD(P)-binding protein n=1 Tax=Mollisia scopiformis TaxID=149040 RepID=A0A194XSP9_MOLSC|nr:NAD(P)-binding protein [Mollisia scopiformis]KUJ23223.1 NAD(P)-binding protein [Mollisia scopiformis]
MGFFLEFLWRQLFVWLPTPNYDFSGQTVIITGSNTGLGREAARHIVRLGAAKVILAVRTPAKGEAAAAEILESTKKTSSIIEVWELNLSSSASVKAFAKRAQGLARLDAVILNAGILTTQFALVEGEESSIVVNVVHNTLLALSLLPKLRESAAKTGLRGRIAFVGSDLQYLAKFAEGETPGNTFDVLRVEEKADMDDRYKVSKLLLACAVRAISAESPVSDKSNVIITYLTPGACKSDLFRDPMGGFQALALAIGKTIIGRSTEVGSRTLVNAVRPNQDVKVHGQFLMDGKVASAGPKINSPEGKKLEEKFHKELYDKLEQLSPGVTKI